MERAGAATVIADGELTPERLRAAVDAIATDPQQRRTMAAAARALARPDAAAEVAGEVLDAAAERALTPR
jgi:UDP-N-acetylglucosamine--N-acetylmuramyl-(pentapeptide) pyrophosphoryl-undecaprenol N-acetylglucosamine transferase